MDYNWANYKVLVAEDDALNYKYVELLLKKRTGIQIIWAKDGQQAVDLCQEDHNINIVLLDLQLPELDGLNALISIKATRPYLPVIIQTANSWNNEDELCKKAGSDGFFNKPLNIEDLLEHMELCLKTHSKNKSMNIRA